MGEQRNERKLLLQQIDQYSFAVDDVKLFLDTHPHDEEALAYFRRYSALRKKALQAYTQRYGALSMDTAKGDRWDWVDTPWPWEGAY